MTTNVTGLVAGSSFAACTQWTDIRVNIYLKFRPEEKTAMWELRQERDTPGWKEHVDPSIASLTRQVAEMIQRLKYSTRGRKRENNEFTMDMSDDDINLNSLVASYKFAASNKSCNIRGRHLSDSYWHPPSASPCDGHTWVHGAAKAMIRILAPVRSVRNVTLTQSSIRMLSSLASNDIDTIL